MEFLIVFGGSKIKNHHFANGSHRNCSLSSQRFSEVRSSKVHCRRVAVVPFRSSVLRALAQAGDKVCYTLPRRCEFLGERSPSIGNPLSGLGTAMLAADLDWMSLHRGFPIEE